ncbi:MAG: AbrB/MazE/SpoVT family DNA-binding domain-containing protein [Stomatobaculum sp.]|nr:AbrB/MazE/SpoVT family DNA-binding domain-containing protein [Stomatobaculum sp.]
MTARTTLRAWGSSQGIVIPKKCLELLDWNISDSLEIEITEGTLCIRKPFSHKTFEERLAAYGGKIEICEFDWGEAKGREML